jgi:hypothetical protein
LLICFTIKDIQKTCSVKFYTNSLDESYSENDLIKKLHELSDRKTSKSMTFDAVKVSM